MRTFTILFGAGVLDAALLTPACLALTIQFGVTDVVNFAFATLLTLTAFAFWLFNSVFGVDLWVAALLAALTCSVATTILGAVVIAPFYRRMPVLLYTLILTFSIWLILGGVLGVIWGANTKVLNYPAWTGHTFNLGPVVLTAIDLIGMTVAAVILVTAYMLLKHTRLGKMMRAMSDDRALAMVCGIPVERTTNLTWALTGFVGGIAGDLFALESHGFDTSIGDTYIYLIFAAIVLGGLGKPLGAVLGAIVIGLSFELSTLVIGTELSPIAVFVVLIAVMLVRPSGLLGATRSFIRAT